MRYYCIIFIQASLPWDGLDNRLCNLRVIIRWGRAGAAASAAHTTHFGCDKVAGIVIATLNPSVRIGDTIVAITVVVVVYVDSSAVVVYVVVVVSVDAHPRCSTDKRDSEERHHGEPKTDFEGHL